MSEVKAAKRQALINRAAGKTDEPMIDQDSEQSYTAQLLIALNWYARESDAKQRKAWVLSYLKKNKRTAELEHAQEVSDWHFYSVGALVRMKMIGSYLNETHEQYIEDQLAELTGKPQVIKKEPTTTKVVPNIQERVLEKSREFCGEVIDGQIDEFIAEGCPANFKIKMNGMNGPTAKYVASVYTKTLDELREAQEGSDKQLVEGYSNFTKVQLKRFIALCETVINNCDQAKKLVVRKPRARKAKPAGEVVKNLKYKKDFAELSLKSVSAPTIVGSTELWVYNTKVRKLQVYRAVNGELLTVKGTSILNYDTANSGQKTMRKPELVTSYAGMTKRPLNTAYKALTSKEAAVNGRINDECILLKVF